MSEESSLAFPSGPARNLASTCIVTSQCALAPDRRSFVMRSLVLKVTLVGLACDQASKIWAFAMGAALAEPRQVIPGLVAALLATNDGAVAHLAGGQPMTATVCGLTGLVMLMSSCWAYLRLGSGKRRDAAFVGLLLSGILGNSVDRLTLGHVRDFIITPLWPALIFNLADVFILLGFLLLLGSWAVSRLG